MLGYWDNAEATRDGHRRRALDAHRRPGHDGRRGLLNIVGRIKDMIIRGGENVYPREIEEFLYSHPKVAGRAGHRRARREVRRGGHGLGAACARARRATAEEIRDYCRGKIAHYKIPRYVQFVDAFPMTVTGKVQKFLMREESVKALGLEQAAAVRMA